MTTTTIGYTCENCDAVIFGVLPADVPHAGMYYHAVCDNCHDELYPIADDDDDDTYDDGCPLCGRKGFCYGYCT